MALINVFDSKFHELLKDGINLFHVQTPEEKDLDEKPKNEAQSKDKVILTCSHCNVEFKNTTEQKSHYKSDWHRYNIKRISRSKSPLALNVFNNKLEKCSVSSDTDESDEFDPQKEILTNRGQLYLKTTKGCVISLYSCLILHKKENVLEVDIAKRLEKYNDKTLCGVFMLGGGRFSGAIFQGKEPVKHKTFHCYTVRAGQGGSQNSCDNRLGSNPKSAGSSLRRYNEQALKQHVGEITEQWAEDIEKCDVIFYKAPGPYNQSVLFGGKKPVLDRADVRVRGIPLSTRKATFSEVKRVFYALILVTIHESEKITLEYISQQKLRLAETLRSKQRNKKQFHRSKSREKQQRSNPCSSSSSSGSSSENEIELVTNDYHISLNKSLKEFEDSLTFQERQQGKNKTKKSKKDRIRAREERERNHLIQTIAEGNLEELKKIFKTTDNNGTENNEVNKVLDEENNVVLHVAAQKEKVELVKWLLEVGADPCLKNKKHQTPYACTQNKEVRDVFKEFAKTHPDLHNYNKANIPVVKEITQEDEEKKKLQKKIKREKKKAKDLEKKMKAEEDAEKQRFLGLSDREKMALAAERRFLNKGGNVLVRCFLCATDISGKVPFEYSGNLFCSTDCLKAHRYKNPIHLS